MGQGYYGTGERALNTFDAVAKRYAETTPIRGKNKGENRRPLGERRYWWNRIVQLDENTYALSDGYWMGYKWADDAIKKTAPIVWERKPDGDYMTVHSHLNGNCSVSRYWFIQNYLPDGFAFDWFSNTGKHFIKYDGKDYYLPKSKASIDWQNLLFDFKNYYKLTFKAEADGKFTRVGDKNLCTVRRLDKTLTKKYRPMIKELWDYMNVMLPVFGESLTHHETKETYANMLSSGSNYWYWTTLIEGESVRNILENDEHEHRIALAVMCATEIGAYEDKRFYPIEKGLSKLNALFNRIGKFYLKEEM
jgi:hypothetical protein